MSGALTKEWLEKHLGDAKRTQHNMRVRKESHIRLPVSGIIAYCDETILICEELLKCMKG